MYAKLKCRSIGVEIRIKSGEDLVVGREQQDRENFYVLDNRYISRMHAVFVYKNELFVQDMNSRNGSFVNGRRLKREEMVPLSEGDFIKLGDIEFRLHYEGKSDRKRESDGFKYEHRNTVGGRKLKITTAERGCIKYQIRMIEENPALNIADVTHVNNIHESFFLCDLGSFISVTDMLEQKPGRVNGEDILERILKSVKSGEECMLNRNRYIISPDTVFMDMNGNIRLIYVPCVDNNEDRFMEGMSVLCDCFLKKCREKDRKKLTALRNVFRSGISETADVMKEVFKLKEYNVEIRRDMIEAEEESEERKIKLKAEYAVTFISFAALIALVWTGKMSATNIAALLLIVAGINVVMYGNKSKKEKAGEKTQKPDKEKKDIREIVSNILKRK